MEDFEKEVESYYRRADFGAKAWSTAYHCTGILSILLSAGAALTATAKLEAWVTAVLAGAAGVLTTISTFSGFSRKWRINRKTRTALRSLRRQLHNGAELSVLRERLDAIMIAHDNGIDAMDGPTT